MFVLQRALLQTLLHISALRQLSRTGNAPASRSGRFGCSVLHKHSAEVYPGDPDGIEYRLRIQRFMGLPRAELDDQWQARAVGQ